MASNGSGLVIVGGGLSTARAIKSFREAGGDSPITLVSRDSKVPYHRPPLSKRYLRGEVEADGTFVEPEDFYREHDVEVLLETTATSLDLDRRAVVLGDGAAREFDTLLIASGAEPRMIDVPGAELQGVFTLRTLDDSTRIREAASGTRHAVVVGAGFIGMEVAASLRQLGLEVTLVHRGQGLFEILRARQVAQFLEELYGQQGVELVLGDEVLRFGGRSQLDAVETKRGRTIQAEVCVVGVGVDPSTAWLHGSGLKVDNGVLVDAQFRTSAEGVYAVGDVANFHDPVFGRRRRIEHWSNANYQGTEVGRVLAGVGDGYDVVSTFFSEVFGVTFKVFGDVDGVDEIVLRGAVEDRDALGFYIRDGRFVGALLVGQEEETESRLKELLRAQPQVRDVAKLGDSAVPLDDALA